MRSAVSLSLMSAFAVALCLSIAPASANGMKGSGSGHSQGGGAVTLDFPGVLGLDPPKQSMGVNFYGKCRHWLDAGIAEKKRGHLKQAHVAFDLFEICIRAQ